MTEKNLRVMIVDDSALYRKVLSAVFNSIANVEVVGTASNGKIALGKVDYLAPDIITLDFEMPEMNGLETLRHLRKSNPDVLVIMVSLFTKQGAAVTLKALELGAHSFVTKPESGNPLSGEKYLFSQLSPIIISMTTRKLTRRLTGRKVSGAAPVLARTRSVQRKKIERTKIVGPAVKPLVVGLVKVVAIGISTGGPNALSLVIPRLPAQLGVPVIIVQHMPELFTAALADSLDQKSEVTVVEGAQGMKLEAGVIYIAPGGKQMKVASRGGGIILEITNDPPENHCKPAADYLFRSVAEVYGNKALAVIMTGMGADGTKGLAVMKRAGAQVIAQNERTCVVFGMPAEAIQAGVTDAVVPLESIAAEIVKRVNGI